MNDREQLKQFFNTTFFDEKGKDKLCDVKLALATDHGIIQIGPIRITAQARVGDLFHAEAERLLSNPGNPSGEMPDQGPIIPDQVLSNESQMGIIETEHGRLYNIEKIEYRKKEFILEHYIKDGKDSQYIIKRMEDGKEMDPDQHKTYQHVLDAYQQKLELEASS